MKRYDMTQITNGALIWLSTSGLFSWGGISFTISKKLLSYTKGVMSRSRIKDLLYYELFDLMYHYFSGSWPKARPYDADLVHMNLKVGELWHSVAYVNLHGCLKIERGAFAEAQAMSGKLAEIGEDYDYQIAIGGKYYLEIKRLVKTRMLDDALVVANVAIAFQKKIEEELRLIYLLGYKAIAQILVNDMDGAEVSLSEAREIKTRKGRVSPYFMNSVILGQFFFDLRRLEKSTTVKDLSNRSRFQKAAHHSGRIALKTSAKYPADRTEVYRLMGLYYWTIDRQKQAIKWWRRSVQEGEQIGARTELARTYMEIGKRLSQPKSAYKEIDGRNAERFLEMAESLFTDMGLKWDLNEMGRIMSTRHTPVR